MGWRSWTGLALAAAVLAGCGGEPEPAASSTAAPPAPSATQTATVSPSPAGSPTDSPSGEACQPFGSTEDVSSDDPLALSTLTGASMRVGQHDCYERFVLEMTGTGQAPGWTVGYRDPMTQDGSGLPVDLRGEADLAITVGVWTVSEFEGRPDEWPPFTGPDDIVTTGFVALQEARNLYAFEGVTQVGLGVDRERPFRVDWLDGPPRLVVDVYTGQQLP